MYPKQQDHGAAGGYTITAHISPGDLSPLPGQEPTPKRVGITSSAFSLHSDPKRNGTSDPRNEDGDSGLLLTAADLRITNHQSAKPDQPCLQHQSAPKDSNIYGRRVTRAVSQAISNTTALSKNKGTNNDDTQDHLPSQGAPAPDNLSVSSVGRSPHPFVATTTGSPSLLLINPDLWSKFHEHTNEMIITKSGRCLFPCLRFKAVGLNPEAIYSIRLDFERLDDQRYRFSNGAWKPVQAARRAIDDLGDKHASILAQESYMHPDLFRTGKHWMKAPISFSKAKLTNSIPSTAPKSSRKRNGPSTNSHIFHMASFYKYRPRVHLAQRSKQSHSVICSSTYTFERTTFIAVTHYQNNRVNDLKKDFNPHARGFRDTVVRTETPVELSSSSLYVKPSTRNLRARKRLRLNHQSTESESDGLDLVYDNKYEFEAEDKETESDEEDLQSRGSSDSSADGINRLCWLDRTNKTMVKIFLGMGGPAENKISHSKPPLHPNEQSPLNAPKSSGCFLSRTLLDATQLSPSKTTRKPALQDSRSRAPVSSPPKHRRPKPHHSRSSKVAAVPKAHTREIEQLREGQGHSMSILTRLGSPSASAQVGTMHNTLSPFVDNALADSLPPLQSNLVNEKTSLSIPSVNRSSLESSALTSPDATEFPNTPSSLPPPLSWYQQFFFWEQPPPNLSHQRNVPLPLKALAPGMSDAPLSVHVVPSQDSQQELMQDSVTPTPPQHKAATYPIQPQLFSEPFVDVEGDIVPGTPVLDTHLLFAAHPSRQEIQPATAFVGDTTGDGCGPVLARSHALVTTILESKTMMSMSPAIATLPLQGYSERTNLELALRDNLRLKAFIRERYGRKAEAEANAVLAMERLQ